MTVLAPIQRGPLTELVLTTLLATGQIIGDGDLPDANWVGQPNLPGSTFEPFGVLSELTADHSEGPLGASQGDWRMPYMLEFFGVRRDQVSWIADRLRGSLDGMRGTKLVLGVNTYKVQYVRTDNLGSPQQINVTNPSFWHQQDGITIWMGKVVG